MPKVGLDTDRRHDAFLAPRLAGGALDLFVHRANILAAITAVKPDLEGIVLDVGCGHMPYRPLLTAPPTRVARYLGLDLEANPIYRNAPDITWRDGRIPLPEASVDAAIATEVFEHCPAPEAVMAQIARVLKPGGLLFFTVPFLWPLHNVPYDEYRYTPYSMARHLSACGFGAVQIEPLGGWDASLAQMLGLWVRRRPMGPYARRMLSALCLPVVRLLHRLDRATPARFEQQPMITGLSGTARKKSTAAPGARTDGVRKADLHAATR